MNRPRLSPDRQEPAYTLFLLQLSNDTHVDPYQFADFIRNNLDWLRPYFVESDEPTDTDPRVENVQAIWLRMQFKQRRVSA